MNWKHKKHGHVVAPSCYADVPEENRNEFEETDENPTHTVEMGDGLNEDEDDSLVFTVIAAAEMLQGNNNDENAEVAAPDVQLGGGSGGGGGAGGEF